MIPEPRYRFERRSVTLDRLLPFPTGRLLGCDVASVDPRHRRRGFHVAGSGRARRFRQARQLKQGSHEQVCRACEANLTLGEPHGAGCEYAEEDPWAVDGDDEADEEEEEEAW
jgi:hypothetical protein